MPDPTEGVIQTPPEPTATPAAPVEPVDVLKELAAQEPTAPGTPTSPAAEAQGAPPSEPIYISANKEALDGLTPEARQIVEGELQKMNSAFTQKTQSLAASQKELDTRSNTPASEVISTMLRNASNPQEVSQIIQGISNDPMFKQGLQTYLSQIGATNSATPTNGQVNPEVLAEMTPEEQQALQRSQQQDQQISGLRTEMTSMRKHLEHERLQGTYGKIYDRSAADKHYNDVESGRRLFTMDDAYKLSTYKQNMQRAFDYGKNGRQLDITEKQNASTQPQSIQTGAESGTEQLLKQPNESHTDFMHRIVDGVKKRMLRHGEARTAPGIKTALPTGAGAGPPPSLN